MLDSIEDGKDRIVLAWPEKPGNGFTLAALAMREARSSGRLASATVAVWPWRNGLTRAARSILVHPQDIADTAKHAMNDHRAGAAWMNSDGLAHIELCMLEMRLRDLLPENAPRRRLRGRPRIEVVVKNPTLLETTAVFPPSAAGYSPDAEHTLRRVSQHTHLNEAGASLTSARASIGNPKTTPFAVLGVPGERSTKRLSRYLNHHLLEERPIELIVVDLTRASRTDLGENWEKRLEILLETLDTLERRRPAIVAICDDPFTLKSSSRLIRSHNAKIKPKRAIPTEIGLYLADRGLLSSSPDLPDQLPKVVFHADIKDASLKSLRNDLLDLLRRFKEAGNLEGLRAVATALSFVRRIACLPLGLNEARIASGILFDADDDVDSGIRAMFLEGMALADLAAIESSGADNGRARPIMHRIEQLVAEWQDETPVSAKLNELLSPQNKPQRILLSVPDRRIAEIALGSDRAIGWDCAVCDHHELATVLDRSYYDQLIVTGPTSKALRTILVSESTPPDVVLLGDASGAGLLAGELLPLTRLDGFSAVAERASGLQAALKRGGLDEKLNLGEAEFRISPAAGSKDIDLSREGERYSGERVSLHTSAHRIVYRPSSDVLVFTSGEARLFEKLPAREIERGDYILVLDESTRNRIRASLATSHKSLEQLANYHQAIARLREQIPGARNLDKARAVLRRMRDIDPDVVDSEIHNVHRWLTADTAPATGEGTRQPGAARDWPRFKLFMEANEVNELLAKTFWDFAIVPTRSYRVQEGFQFNQRVVQFVLDPESTHGAKANTVGLRQLWLSLQDAVDEVENIEILKEDPRHG
ncbi:hypothetical protein [Devosia chinhatensis]|uniref:hypothetical protein n=1 Tax=Devosia chinhatensis TaxID=429727 RepID=UPI00128BEE2A|nr:hypothetical protein [Devosia chinhatensis]